MSYLKKYKFPKKQKTYILKYLKWQKIKMKLQQRQYVFHVIVNANSIAQHVIQIKNGIMKPVNVKINLSTCICENSKYLKSIADTSVIACEEIISVMDIIVSTKITNTTATNLRKDCHSKKLRYKSDCYILHTDLLAILLILTITIICYIMQRISKKKDIEALKI